MAVNSTYSSIRPIDAHTMYTQTALQRQSWIAEHKTVLLKILEKQKIVEKFLYRLKFPLNMLCCAVLCVLYIVRE